MTARGASACNDASRAGERVSHWSFGLAYARRGRELQRDSSPVVWFVDIFGSSRRKETKKKRKKQHRVHAATELLLERMRNAECALVVYSYENKWAYT